MNYRAMCAYAGEYLGTLMPDPIHIGQGEAVPAVSVGVYVAVGLDGEVLYVGSATRPLDEYGVRSRIEEHLRRHERRELWESVYIVPLLNDTPLSEVRRIEGRIGRHLAPRTTRALPNLRGPSRSL